MRASLLGDWRQARPYQRLGYLVGGTLVLVGLAHLAAWLAVGGAWAGPVSLHKPTAFGLTTITLASELTPLRLLGTLVVGTGVTVGVASRRIAAFAPGRLAAVSRVR